MAIDRFVDASVYSVLRDAEPSKPGTHQLAVESQTAVGFCEETEPIN